MSTAVIYFNIVDYGAVGDYNDSANTGTDNKSAFDAAFAAAKSAASRGAICCVYVPKGNFAVKSNMAAVDGSPSSTPTYFGLRFCGEGPASRIVFPQQGASQPGFQFRNLDFIEVDHLAFTGRDDTTPTIDCASAISISASFLATVHNCIFNGLYCDAAVIDYYQAGSLTENNRFQMCCHDPDNGFGLVSHRNTYRASVLRNVIDETPVGGIAFANRIFYQPNCYYFGDCVDDQEMLVQGNSSQYGRCGVLVNPSANNYPYYHMRICNNGIALTNADVIGAVVVQGVGAHTVEIEQNSLYVQYPCNIYDIDNVDRVSMVDLLKNDPNRLSDQLYGTSNIRFGSGVKVADLVNVQYDSMIVDPTVTRVSLRNDGIDARIRIGDSTVNTASVLVKAGASAEKVTLFGTGDAPGVATGVALEPTVKATGYCTCPDPSSILDGTLWTVTDGTHTVTFEFDKTSTHYGHTVVDISAATTADDVKNALIAAWAGTALTITASDHGASTGRVDLTFNTIGEIGNILLVGTDPYVGFTISGLFGGRSNIRVAELWGQEVPIKSDGVASLASGDALTTSLTSAGRVAKSTVAGTPLVARATADATASADEIVNALFGKQSVDTLALAARTVIYVRSGGSDTTGDGTTSGTAFRTVQRALDTIPLHHPNGRRYVIDVTGLSDTSQAIVIPPFHNSDPLATNGSPINVAFADEGYVTIQATPSVLDTLNSGTTSYASDSVSGLLQVTDTSKSYSTDQHKGKFLLGSGPGEYAVIARNTATHLFTSSFAASFTAPVKIVDVGATLTGNGSTPTISANNVRAKVVLQGVGLPGAVCLGGSGFEYLELSLCAIGRPNLNGGGRLSLNATYMLGANSVAAVDSVFQVDTIKALFVYFKDLSPIFNGSSIEIEGGSLENCRMFDSGGGAGIGIELANVEMLTQGLVLLGTGTACVISNFRADNVAAVAHINPNGSGIIVEGGASLSLYEAGAVGGSGNAGYGIELVAQGGAFMENGHSVTFTITGTLGDLRVGNRPVRTWSNFTGTAPINHEVCLSHGSRIGFNTADSDGIASYGRGTKAVSSATVAFDFTNVEQLDATLSVNVTSISFSGLASGIPRRIVLTLIQDATGSRTLAGWPGTVKWLPSTYRGATKTAPTFSTGANKRDTVIFQWDGTNLLQLSESLGN